MSYRPGDNKILKTAWILLILTLASTCFISGVLARYVATDAGADSARTAAMHIGGDIFSVDLSDIEKPGDSKDITITVYGQAEVSLRYRLGISLNGSMPLEFSLSKTIRTEAPGGGSQLETTTRLLSSTLDDLDDAIRAGEMPILLLTEPEDLPPNTSPEGEYSLHVEWASDTSDDTSLYYPNLEDPYGRSVLTVGLYAEQID